MLAVGGSRYRPSGSSSGRGDYSGGGADPFTGIIIYVYYRHVYIMYNVYTYLHV